jgi:hypothetical protein
LRAGMRLDPGRSDPICLDGYGSCPPEDCGGVNGFLAWRDAWTAPETRHDFAVLTDFVN